MQSLLNDDFVTLGWIVVPSAHRAVPPFHGRSALRIRFGLVNAVRIIYHDVIAALTSAGSHWHHHSIPSLIVLETLLLVLIASQLKAVTPALPIPVRFDQASVFQAVPNCQRLPVAGEEPSVSGWSIQTQAGQKTPTSSDLACPGGTLMIKSLIRPSVTP